jgi:hypothetical protein
MMDFLLGRCVDFVDLVSQTWMVDHENWIVVINQAIFLSNFLIHDLLQFFKIKLSKFKVFNASHEKFYILKM